MKNTELSKEQEKNRILEIIIYILVVINLVMTCVNVYYISQVQSTQCIEIETGK